MTTSKSTRPTPFELGQLAARQGLPHSVCPHPYGSVECEEWVDGWNSVKYYAA